MSLSFGGGLNFPVSLVILAAVIVYASEHYQDPGLMPWAGACVLVAMVYQAAWLLIVYDRTKR
jgi:hypothetical protein